MDFPLDIELDPKTGEELSLDCSSSEGKFNELSPNEEVDSTVIKTDDLEKGILIDSDSTNSTDKSESVALLQSHITLKRSGSSNASPTIRARSIRVKTEAIPIPLKPASPVTPVTAPNIVPISAPMDTDSLHTASFRNDDLRNDLRSALSRNRQVNTNEPMENFKITAMVGKDKSSRKIELLRNDSSTTPNMQVKTTESAFSEDFIVVDEVQYENNVVEEDRLSVNADDDFTTAAAPSVSEKNAAAKQAKQKQPPPKPSGSTSAPKASIKPVLKQPPSKPTEQQYE